MSEAEIIEEEAGERVENFIFDYQANELHCSCRQVNNNVDGGKDMGFPTCKFGGAPAPPPQILGLLHWNGVSP